MGAIRMSQCPDTPDIPKSQAPQPSDDGLLRRIRHYWSRRADGFGRVRREEVRGDKLRLWSEEILPYLPVPLYGGRLRVLDVGTGAGFFAVLLARQAGCDVTGIDLCDDMLCEAEGLARQCGCVARFLRMDAAALDFADDMFDCLLVRNLTWTLLRPEAAYAEWRRVLRPGGVLLNFDADYGSVDFTEFAAERGQHAHADLDAALLWEGEDIRRQLPLSDMKRPEWDAEILRQIGFSSVAVDLGISGRVYAVRDASYNPVPMFGLRAVK
ncbi:MAG: methyltransferase domain-containing protein [Desulfovibrio sp.]|nr:methyltransferase domain-containing protein [Desulfovibrio sp.]